MKLSYLVMLSAVALIGSGVCHSSIAVAAEAPAADTDSKAAISKACTEQANAQGLKGKKRKHFRSTCKKNGGKTG